MELADIAHMNLMPVFASLFAAVAFLGFSGGNVKKALGVATKFVATGESFAYKGGTITGEIKLPPERAKAFESQMNALIKQREALINDAHVQYNIALRNLFLEFNKYETHVDDVGGVAGARLEPTVNLTDEDEVEDDGLTIPVAPRSKRG